MNEYHSSKKWQFLGHANSQNSQNSHNSHDSHNNQSSKRSQNSKRSPNRKNEAIFLKVWKLLVLSYCAFFTSFRCRFTTFMMVVKAARMPSFLRLNSNQEARICLVKCESVRGFGFKSVFDLSMTHPKLDWRSKAWKLPRAPPKYWRMIWSKWLTRITPHRRLLSVWCRREMKLYRVIYKMKGFLDKPGIHFR